MLNVQLKPANHKPHFLALRRLTAEANQSQAALELAGDVLLLRAYASFTHTQSAEELKKGEN